MRTGALLPLLCVTTGVLAGAARAQDAFFPNDATVDFTINGETYVGYANNADRIAGTNGTSPTVNVVNGADLGRSLSSYNSSVINMSGGILSSTSAAFLIAIDNSTINLSGGTVGTGTSGQAEARNNSTLNITGGAVNRNVVGSNNGRVNVSGGAIGGGFNMTGSSTLDFSGGTAAFFGGANNAAVNATLRGGTITGNVTANGTSMVQLSGTSVGGNVTAAFTSMVDILGGTINGIVNANASSIVDIFGGAFGGDFFARTSGAINFFGPDIDALLVNPDASGFSQYALSGMLQNGGSLDGRLLNIQNGSNARFSINRTSAVIPEPGTLALLAGGLPGLLALRRRRR